MPPFPLNKANSIINKLFNLSFYWGTLKPNFNGVQWSRSWCSFKVILRPAKVFPSSPEKSPFLLRCQKSDQSCQIKTNRNYLGKKIKRRFFGSSSGSKWVEAIVSDFFAPIIPHSLVLFFTTRWHQLIASWGSLAARAENECGRSRPALAAADVEKEGLGIRNLESDYQAESRIGKSLMFWR